MAEVPEPSSAAEVPEPLGEGLEAPAPESDPEPATPAGGGGLVRVRIDLAYDGSGFSGWARQPGRATVQQTLEDALAQVLRLDASPQLTVAGRTDAGVHARGQVCHVDLPAEAVDALDRLPARLAGVLPTSVVVHAAAIAPEGFDARFSALSRRYAYRIADRIDAVDPLRRDALRHRRELEVGAMDRAAVPLVGEHDFAAYCRQREGATTIRRVLVLRCSREASGLARVDIEADAFCHNMVRAIVGALVAVGERRRPETWPGDLLAAGVRDSAVTVLPPDGLTLEAVRYPADDGLAARAAVTRRVRDG